MEHPPRVTDLAASNSCRTLTTYVSRQRIKPGRRKTRIAARGGHLRLGRCRRNFNCTNRRVYDSRPFIHTCARIDVVERNYGGPRSLSRRARTSRARQREASALAKIRLARASLLIPARKRDGHAGEGSCVNSARSRTRRRERRGGNRSRKPPRFPRSNAERIRLARVTLPLLFPRRTDPYALPAATR